MKTLQRRSLFVIGALFLLAAIGLHASANLFAIVGQRIGLRAARMDPAWKPTSP